MKMLILGFILLSASSTFADTKVVVMKSLSYDPKVLDIKLNDSVEWENKSLTEHSATAENDALLNFDTGLTEPGKKTRKIKFTAAGTYNYHCSLHGKTMSGQIIVKP